MTKIKWTGLPPALRDHLFNPLRKRKKSVGPVLPNPSALNVKR